MIQENSQWDYWFGFFLGDIIGHTGGMKGFGASLFYHPKRNIFVCVMINDDIKAVDPAMFKFLEVMMEL